MCRWYDVSWRRSHEWREVILGVRRLSIRHVRRGGFDLKHSKGVVVSRAGLMDVKRRGQVYGEDQKHLNSSSSIFSRCENGGTGMVEFKSAGSVNGGSADA